MITFNCFVFSESVFSSVMLEITLEVWLIFCFPFLLFFLSGGGRGGWEKGMIRRAPFLSFSFRYLTAFSVA